MNGPSLNLLTAVFVGGGIGSVLRFAISFFLNKSDVAKLPFGTITANVLSCIVMGVTIAFFSDKLSESESLKAFILIGFCGGLSTFSTFSFETFDLIKSDQLGLALLNVFISIIMCLVIFYFFAKRV